MKAKKNGAASPEKKRNTAHDKKKNGESQANGKSVNGDSTTADAPKQSLVLSGVIALLSLAAGVLTPPILTYHNASHPLGGANVIQMWMAKAFRGIPACTEEALSGFLHDEPVEGLHVICVEQQPGTSDLSLKLYSGAHLDTDGPIEVSVEATKKNSAAEQWSSLQQSLIAELELRTQDELHQAWAMFSPIGKRIAEEDEGWKNEERSKQIIQSLVNTGMVLLYEGGQWLWPGVREGFKRTVDLYSIMPGDAPKSEYSNETRTVVLETISLKPLVVSVEGFLSPLECDHVQEVAEPDMEYSPVVLMDKDQGKEASEWRTSKTAFIAGEDDIFLDLEYRTASLVRIPKDHQEDLQVLRYGITEHYLGHTDYFDPQHYQKDPGTLEMIQYGRRNRLATVFWYLSDVTEGGETAFPYAVGRESKIDCEDGLMVKPERGKVIIFYSLTASGRMDVLSTHAACPIKKGIKWAANKWVWNSAFGEDE